MTPGNVESDGTWHVFHKKLADKGVGYWMIAGIDLVSPEAEIEIAVCWWNVSVLGSKPLNVATRCPCSAMRSRGGDRYLLISESDQGQKVSNGNQT